MCKLKTIIILYLSGFQISSKRNQMIIWLIADQTWVDKMTITSQLIFVFQNFPHFNVGEVQIVDPFNMGKAMKPVWNFKWAVQTSFIHSM